jgi:soluble lytic murein transglycosylase
VTSDLLQTYLVLRRLSLTELAEQYLLDRLEISSRDSALRFTLSRLRSERGATTLALFDARRSAPRYVEYQFGEFPEEFWTLLYPRDYLPIVDRYAQEAGLDPHLVLGLIRQESAFNPLARSVANAVGLMQILPQTVSKTRRGRSTAAHRLLEPEYNIKFGTAYLKGRLTALDEVPEQALAAYHAGEGRVQDWRIQHQFQEPAEFLESIPIPSTRAYVEAVLRDAGIYRELLDGSAQYAKCQ